jgi:hypothetical protein
MDRLSNDAIGTGMRGALDHDRTGAGSLRPSRFTGDDGPLWSRSRRCVEAGLAWRCPGDLDHVEGDTPVEVVTDAAAVYSRVLDELIPAAWHHVERWANNRIEADHGRLKHRLRPMRGLCTDRTATVIITGLAFLQNLRRCSACSGPSLAIICMRDGRSAKIACVVTNQGIYLRLAVAPPWTRHKSIKPAASTITDWIMALWCHPGQPSRPLVGGEFVGQAHHEGLEVRRQGCDW